jgi:hypothetical protein
MPEARLQRTRLLNDDEALEGVRFMRAARPNCRHEIAMRESDGSSICLNCGWPVSRAGRAAVDLRWRAPHENAAEQIERRAEWPEPYLTQCDPGDETPWGV